MNQLDEARKYEGLEEVRDKAKLQALIKFDPASQPWCAAFVNAIEKACGRKGTGLLNARSYLNYGAGVRFDDRQPGDIIVFTRGGNTWQGHVSYYVSDKLGYVKVIGGNQDNKVCEKLYEVGRILGIRRP